MPHGLANDFESQKTKQNKTKQKQNKTKQKQNETKQKQKTKNKKQKHFTSVVFNIFIRNIFVVRSKLKYL